MPTLWTLRRTFSYASHQSPRNGLRSALLLFLTFPVYAENNVSEADFLSDIPVAISVTRQSHPLLETPASVTIIEREMIKQLGFVNITDIFRLVPGMVVAHDYGPRAVVSYHGLTSRYARRIQVLIDGRSVYLPSFGGVVWQDLPLTIDDIERVEIIRGPNAAAYGANSFLGVISITTRLPATHAGWTTQALLGNNEVRQGWVRYGGTGDHGAYRIDAQYDAGGGADAINDSYQLKKTSFRLDHQPNATNTFEVYAGYSNARTDESTTTGSNRPIPTTTAHENASYAQVTWRHTADSAREIIVNTYLTQRKRDHSWVEGPYDLRFFGNYPRDAMVSFNADIDEQRAEIEWQYSHAPGSRWRFVGGAGLRSDRMVSYSTFGDNRPRWQQTQRLFANTEIHLTPATLLNLGGMWEKRSDIGGDFSPRLALNHYLTPHQTIRFSATQSYRNPTFYENEATTNLVYEGTTLRSIIAASGGLRSEHIKSYEIGYMLSSKNRKMLLDVRLYRDQLDHLIDIYQASPTEPLNFRNMDHASIRGAETQWSYRDKNILLWLTYAYADVNSSDIDADYSKSTPRHTTSFATGYIFTPQWRAGLIYEFVDDLQFLGQAKTQPNYQRVDLHLTYLFERAYQRGEITLGGQNLIDEHFELAPTNIRSAQWYIRARARF